MNQRLDKALNISVVQLHKCGEKDKYRIKEFCEF